MTVLPLVALLAAGTIPPPGAPPGVHADPAAVSTDAHKAYEMFQVPPEGSKEDVELWTRGRDVSKEVTIARHLATKVQVDANKASWRDRLEQAVERKELPKEQADKLYRAVVDRWGELTYFVTGRWPVDPTRVCQQYFLLFDSAIRSQKLDGGKGLNEVRGYLKPCVAAATEIDGKLRGQVRALEEAVAEVVKATPKFDLSAVRPKPAPAPAARPATPPAKAPAPAAK